MPWMQTEAAQWNRMEFGYFHVCYFEMHGCSQSSRFPIAGQEKRSLGKEIVYFFDIWSIATCKNKVSADQYHVAISRLK